NSAQGRLTGLSPGARLGLMALTNLLLFGAFPLVSAWLGRGGAVEGFRLRWAGGLAWAGGVLVGLWRAAFPPRAGARARAWGGGVPEEVLKESEKLLASWRELSPVLVVLALGLVPAVVEELFFRGYLFRGLEALAGPLGVVLATSLLFALFHLWMPGALAA